MHALNLCAIASSGGGEVASAHEGAASHMAPEGHATDSEYTSETEGEWSSTTGTRGDVSDTDTSSEGSSLAVAATSVPTATTGTAATQRTSPALPAAPQPSPRARSARKPGISFAPGTSGPAPVTPASLSEEVIDLLRTLIVGQSTLLNAIHGVEREVHRSNTYLEGIHSGTSASSKGTASPPPGKRTKKTKGRRDKPETAATKDSSLARHLPHHQREARATELQRRRAWAAGRRSQAAGELSRRAPPAPFRL
ncbi:hypothetical protein NDU88_004595 [Pleurodeles waltl]|uniref:Uncharacterized protein n=1 Tax=Pleurodeles waltl TaxID=8319 RepID=A0AAV7W8R0_PLEWA|nr:hypothetical protein NDU88_004595 [Pleurodeles waltl]